MIGGVRVAGVIMGFGFTGLGIGWFVAAVQLHDYGFPIIAGLIWTALGLGAIIMTTVEALHIRGRL